MSIALILQLSDIHFKATDKVIADRGTGIAAAIQAQLSSCETVVIAITGDIANSGKSEEYVHATTLLSALSSDIFSRHGKSPEIIMVPGNHDCDIESPKNKQRLRTIKQLKTVSESADEADPDGLRPAFAVHRPALSAVPDD